LHPFKQLHYNGDSQLHQTAKGSAV